MPRPRKDSEILSATERLENAFWELLADHEYRKITVTEVVREAHVNRNSFYYHYASLPELADSAIMHAVEHSTVQAPRADLNCVLSSCYRPVWREFSFRKSGRF